jgi:indole-3-glycerol phosphate synthase
MFLDRAMERARVSACERESKAPVSTLERALADSVQPVPSFASAIRRGEGAVKVIAEVKRFSPTAGRVNSGATVAATAAEYEKAGADAVSVLTSGFGFRGSVLDLEEARTACALPLLCKDFISLEYQVLEARAFGASAFLLIAEALGREELAGLIARGREVGMDALVEAHTAGGVDRAVDAGAGIIGINNRDLATLDVDISTTEELRGLIPPGCLVVSESGIRTADDVERMASAGVDALLIGEALMRAPEPGTRLEELTGR